MIDSKMLKFELVNEAMAARVGKPSSNILRKQSDQDMMRLEVLKLNCTQLDCLQKLQLNKETHFRGDTLYIQNEK